MKVLLTHRYFWPDTSPYAIILRSIGDHLVECDHDVSVYSSRPSYREAVKAPGREKLGGLNVKRAWVLKENRKNPLSRGLNVGLYCLGLFFHILKTRPDVVTACTFPPVMAAWTASFASQLIGARFVYHMMDIHPEVSAYSNGALGRGLMLKILRGLDNQSLRRAANIIVLSDDMAGSLRARNVGELPIQVVDNVHLETFGENQLPPEAYRKTAGKTRVTFAGNLGRFQNLLSLAEGISFCFESRPDLELLFLGDGAVESDLKARWADHPQVTFIPFLPFAQAKVLIAESDIGLVSLAPNIFKVAYPSKVMNYLKLGLPIFALVEPESHMARSLTEARVGAVPQSEKPEDISQAFEGFLLKVSQGKLPKNLTQDFASNAEILGEWADIIGRLDKTA